MLGALTFISPGVSASEPPTAGSLLTTETFVTIAESSS